MSHETARCAYGARFGAVMDRLFVDRLHLTVLPLRFLPPTNRVVDKLRVKACGFARDNTSERLFKVSYFPRVL